ncbi:MAG: DEAD/DEAH box helicase [Nitrospinae bacterium CG11_big_fil_rev_8_21_14_0_20_56_8]|nr:MAG: DEAD/DEAH box helicase [Nitrospinae bacterium CG11_big_fil_rev_8_21_14_0_20_56_8]
MITPYHAKYFAFELTKRCPSDSIEKLAGALVDAQVDLNPHQVEAALFAFKSPLSKGALLADEVGLGKTIEAGLVLSQKWAERRRRILIITPSNLRKQWHQELQEKFFLPATILESRSYNAEIKKGNLSPFEIKDSIILCSYQFARNKASDVSRIPWDLVVIDEAHRLRNVYKPSNVIANTLKQALQNAPKLLLTATPLQNSLLELYGLVSIIDDQVFGDFKSFRDQFSNINDPENFGYLKSRLKPFCQRTLRRQVTTYVPYTERHPMLQTFEPSESEDRLYNLVSEYLCRDNLQALPTSQRSLMTLVLRKLLASSSFAIAGALNSLIRRLENQLAKAKPPEETLEEELDRDYEALDETADEWPEDEAIEPLSEGDRKAIEREITDLKSFHDLAVSITINKKGEALLKALGHAFKDRSPEEKKAIIFTESRKTQDYLLRTLMDSPYGDGIVLFNGSNNDPKSRQIYAEWFELHKDTDKVTGSRTADMRSALVDYFRDKGQIMIATEAGGEGINLQFCSLVVNYDLPWNPQRIEQRIGRCHRYGQKNDVVVVNFLNQKNEADKRVFQLLSEKFSLFEGVFGASDEVLGAIESGVDFEKRITAIYQRCRTPEEIKASFDQLQLELSSQIDDSIKKTRQQLLENFDAEVHEKLRVNMANSREYLNRYEQNLMLLTQFELNGNAEFHDGLNAFILKANPFHGANDNIPLGRYELPRRSGEAHLYRLGHPLAEQVLKQARERPLPPAEMVLDYASGPKVTVLEPLLGKSGELAVSMFTVESLDQAEDYLLFAAVTEEGQMVEEDVARRLLSMPPTSTTPVNRLNSVDALDTLLEKRKVKIVQSVSERNAKFFEQEAEKLDNWAEDLKLTLEREIKDIDRQIREAKKAAKAALTLEEKLAGQKQIKALESTRNTKRRSLFEAQDEIDALREKLISSIEEKLKQKTSMIEIFKIRWRLT